ncbi:hypothetical protein HDK77DRAFT_295909 [Phyllosticta capitalensis]|uniref:uncharacterized protein n=1 Tax=Phyllosticta capitalensis TaxID=121624 RepID=UPI003131CA2C
MALDTLSENHLTTTSPHFVFWLFGRGGRGPDTRSPICLAAAVLLFLSRFPSATHSRHPGRQARWVLIIEHSVHRRSLFISRSRSQSRHSLLCHPIARAYSTYSRHRVPVSIPPLLYRNTRCFLVPSQISLARVLLLGPCLLFVGPLVSEKSTLFAHTWPSTTHNQ